jgi:hypothetical protein
VPRAGFGDHLITAQKAELLRIDCQPSQLAGLRSMDHALLVKNAVSTLRTIKTFGVALVHSKVNVASGRRRPPFPSSLSWYRTTSPLDQTTVNLAYEFVVSIGLAAQAQPPWIASVSSTRVPLTSSGSRRPRPR